MEKKLNIRHISNLEDEEEIINHILKGRKIDDIETFLNPDDSELLPWSTIPRMDEGISLVLRGLEENKNFYLNIDSDVDGVTSGTIMHDWLENYYKVRGIDKEINYHISQDKTHGTSEALIEKLEKVKPDILIVMDSLDPNTDRYERIREMGIDILVLDHHEIQSVIPYDEVVVLVSSNRSMNTELSGAGIVWKFCVALDEKLADIELDWDMYYTYDNLSDLGAVGLIADMMKMDKDHMENRFIVAHGLRNLKNGALAELSAGKDFCSNTVSFNISPVINAACRYSQNDLAIKAFITKDELERKQALRILHKYRAKQQDDVRELRSMLTSDIEYQSEQPYLILTVATPYGITGLIANQIQKEYQKPTFVVKKMPSGLGGSCRTSLNLRSTVHRLTPSVDALGHEGAFGFFISYDEVEEFKNKLSKYLANTTREIVIDIDCQISAEEITQDLIDRVKQISFVSGQGYESPRFMVEANDLIVSKTKNEKHLIFEDEYGTYYIKYNAGAEYDKIVDDFDGSSNVRFIGTLYSGPWGRSYKRQFIIDSYEIM